MNKAVHLSLCLGALVYVLSPSPSAFAQPQWSLAKPEIRSTYLLESSYTADSDLRHHSTEQGDLSTFLLRASYTHFWSPNDSYTWGLGPFFEYAHFDTPSQAPIPEHGYVTALQLLSEWRMAERWSLRTTLRPGLYSDFQDVSWEDFNAPLLAVLGFEATPNLLLALAVNVNFRSDLATIGGPGLRWRFAEDWSLNLFLPRPTLEYAVSPLLTCYGGGEWRTITFRTHESFGTRRGLPELDDDDFSYRELRGLAGVRLHLDPKFRLSLEAGYAFQRKAEFRHADTTAKADGAPFLQLLLSGSF